MAIELPADLIEAQQRADALRARVAEVSAAHGRPTAGEGWTPEQHAVWQSAWEEWRRAVDPVQDRITEVAAELGEPRSLVEAELKRRVRHAEPGAGA
ncbi:hypothetical protein [Streptomyces fradiae]|uniref:Uncharacterized protein n=1 Tax=Streptomyces fradiae ATCC 10745 = DSM 40063 TaxID=1319510 RepID=A0A1Y2NPU5_STRFR|nr:hypothetical protein [Streptomyces fradiae]KAF0646292.1 hypothetical protein K701_29445 [Streptomyces fradiae ATCC 10745 = DSM 40063]OSY49077.1 hypothetical protein BG846_05316 [Streptomyces fradiae ATCC 10745 = DSM 40063]